MTDPSDTEVMLKPLVNMSMGQSGQFIQVKAKVDPFDEKKKSLIKATKSARIAKPGTGGAGVSPSNGRKADAERYNMDCSDGTNGTSESAPKKVRTAGSPAVGASRYSNLRGLASRYTGIAVKPPPVHPVVETGVVDPSE